MATEMVFLKRIALHDGLGTIYESHHLLVMFSTFKTVQCEKSC